MSLAAVSRPTRMMTDFRLAVRGLLRDYGVTLVALVSLAIGIAANTTIFSLVQAVEFPNLIYPDASRVVFLESRNPGQGLGGMPVSAPDALDIATSSRSLGRTSLTVDQSSVLREGDIARRISGRRVADAFFEVMGVMPAHGRVWPDGDGPGVVVVGHELWREVFHGDPGLVGRSVRIDGGVVTVVGIMPERFDPDADFWVPLSGSPGASPRDDRQFMMFGRLAPGASLDQATRELTEISARLAADAPATNKGWVTVPVLLSRLHGNDSRGTFLMLQAAVGFVLLIACANIANILLARGTRRRHEMALRMALGANRRQLLRQLLTESVLLSLAGGALGAVLSLWGIRLARALGGFPDVLDPSLNPLVLGFTAALAMATGVLSGLVPALTASRSTPGAVMRTEGGRGTSRSGGRVRMAMVAVQVAGAIVLATGGSLMLQSFANRQQVDLGFDVRNAIRADLSLAGDRYADVNAAGITVAAIIDRLGSQPDVLAAGAVTWALPTAPGAQRTLYLPANPSVVLTAGVRVQAVTPRYFDAMGIPAISGRIFTDADRAGAQPIAIVNDDLARRLWPDGGAVGQRLRLGAHDEAAPEVTVVGVVGSIRRSAMHDAAAPGVYLPFAQYPNATVQLVVRARGGESRDASVLPRALTRALAQEDATLIAEGVRTLQDDTGQFVAPLRLVTTLLTGFGVTGFLLAALGVFGAMSYAVSQRAREMAVRSALGATRGDLVRLVLGNALVAVLAGVVPGIAAALISARVLRSELFGVTASDPITLAAVAVALVLVSLAACYRPARTAALTDPMTVLRRE